MPGLPFLVRMDQLNAKQNLLHKIAVYLFSVWCGLLAVANVLVFLKASAAWYVSLFSAAAAVFVIALCYALAKPFSKLNGVKLVLLLFVLSLVLKLAVVWLIAPAEYSDYQTFRAGAAFIAMGDVSFVTRLPYYSIWAYQFGFEWIISLIFKLFGRWDPVFGLVVNSFFAAGCTPLLAAVGEKITAHRHAVFAALLFTVLPITIDLSAVFTNQHVSLFFILLSVWIILKRPDWLGGILAGLSLGMAKVARADVLMYLAAILVSFLLLKREKKPLSGLVCMVACYFGIFKLVEIIIRPLQPYGLGNNFPLYKFAVGLDESSWGRYSVRMQEEIFNNETYVADHALRDAETMNIIKEELSIGPARLLKLFAMKVRIQWANLFHQYEILHDVLQAPTCEVLGRTVSTQTLNQVLLLWDCFIRFLLFSASAVCGWLTARKKEVSIGFSILMMAFMAFSAIAFLIEVQYRYVYFVFPAICVAAAILADPQRKNEE